MKRRKIPTNWTKIWFTCCNGQCIANAHEFFNGANFEVSNISKLGTFRVKLRRREAVQLLNMAGFTNDKRAIKKVYQAIER